MGSSKIEIDEPDFLALGKLQKDPQKNTNSSSKKNITKQESESLKNEIINKGKKITDSFQIKLKLSKAKKELEEYWKTLELDKLNDSDIVEAIPESNYSHSLQASVGTIRKNPQILHSIKAGHIFDELQEKIINSSTLSRREAENMAKSKDYSGIYSEDAEDKNGFKEETKQFAIDFYHIANGLGSSATQGFLKAKKDNRAYFDAKKGYINIGNKLEINNGNKGKQTIWHEMGHAIEHENLEIAKAAKSFVESRSSSDRPKPLNDLVKGAKYGEHELAYPDSFIHPYVGRAYPTDSTEVVSVGMEHFTDGQSMSKLYSADPEHFHFILGVLNHKKQR